MLYLVEVSELIASKETINFKFFRVYTLFFYKLVVGHFFFFSKIS